MGIGIFLWFYFDSFQLLKWWKKTRQQKSTGMIQCFAFHVGNHIGICRMLTWVRKNVTLLKLFRRAIVCDVSYTFFCHYKLCNVSLIRSISNLIFIFMSISHFFGLYVIYIFWILYHKSHYQYFISNDIGIAKILFFSYNFFWKNRTFISNTPQYLFFCFVIWHQYHFDTITHFSTISCSSIQRHPFC